MRQHIVNLTIFLRLFAGVVLLTATASIAQWERTPGGPYGPISSMASKDGKLFATTGDYEFTGGILRSTDLGSTWKFVNNGLSPKGLYKVVSGKNYVFVYSDKDILRTSDYGETWVKCDSGLPSVNRRGYLYVIGSDLYFYIPYVGVYCSSNEGDSWGSIHEDWPSISVMTSIDSLVIAGTYQDGVYVSIDHGLTWNSAGLAGEQITALITFNDNIFAGVGYNSIFYSSDRGISWIPINKGLYSANTSSFAVTDSFLFAVHGGDVYDLKFGDTVWNRSRMQSNSFRALLVSIDSFVFEGTYEGGILRTSTNYKNWTRVDPWLNILDPGLEPALKANSRIVFNGQYRSENNGDSWVPPSFSDTAKSAPYFPYIFDGLGSKTIYGYYRNDITRQGCIVAASIDNPEHWGCILAGKINSLYVSNDQLFAVLQDYGKSDSVCHSLDNGISWQKINYQSHTDYDIYDIVVGGKDIYLSIGSALFYPDPKIVGVFRSTDNGNSWIKTNLSGSHLLVMDSEVFSIYYTGPDKSVLSRASSYGAGTPVSLLPGFTIYQYIAKAGHLFAATNMGVFQSTDKGDTWTDISQELKKPNYFLYKTIAANDTFLLVSNSSNSVWRRKLSELGVEVKIEEPSLLLQSLTVYPNPSLGNINIKIEIADKVTCLLSIFDELGREVRHLHDGFLDAGEHEFSAELPTGMYYVRMQGGDEVLTRKVTVVR